MPIAFKADIQTTFKVSVNELINFNLAQDIFLHDKETNIYYDIKNSFFSITLPPGVYKNRFEITFKNQENTLSLEDEIVKSFEVYQNNDSQFLTIFNPMQQEVKLLSLYDVTGKMVVNKNNLGNASEIQVSTSGLTDGVYFVKLSTLENKNIDKKIVVSRQ